MTSVRGATPDQELELDLLEIRMMALQHLGRTSPAGSTRRRLALIDLGRTHAAWHRQLDTTYGTHRALDKDIAAR